MMATRHILTADYDDLTLEERANALRWAYQEGRDAAASDRAAGGCGPDDVERPEATLADYVAYVVEPVYHAEECSDAELEYFRSADAASDPRVEAFRRGWRDSQRDYLADLASA